MLCGILSALTALPCSLPFLPFAGRKTSGSMDMTLSALLGAATMNNTFCLAIFLALVYGRGLVWAFSAEVSAQLYIAKFQLRLRYITILQVLYNIVL